ncbi:MAG: hypothetical protein AB2761_20035 [Candidatus Thiodiazotropha endolucinida]
MQSRDNQINALVVELLKNEYDTCLRTKRVPSKNSRQPPSEEQVNKADIVISAFREKLNSLNDDEFKSLLENKLALIEESERARDLVRFFNQPGAEVDYEYWSQLSYWTAEETAALITDKNPKIVTRKSLEQYSIISPYAIQFLRIYEILSRAIQSYELDESMTPFRLLAWADGKGLSIPDGLTKAIKSRPGYVDWRAAYHELKQESGTLASNCKSLVKALLDKLKGYQDQHNEDQTQNNLFQSMDKLQWSEITIIFISDETVTISARGERMIANYAELGFKKATDGGPTLAWESLLTRFANTKQAKTHKHDTSLKSRIKEIRKGLKQFFGIDSDPFHSVKGKDAPKPGDWVPKIRIYDNRNTEEYPFDYSGDAADKWLRDNS